MHTFYLLKHKQEMKMRNVHIPYSAIGQKVWYTLDRLTRYQSFMDPRIIQPMCVFARDGPCKLHTERAQPVGGFKSRTFSL